MRFFNAVQVLEIFEMLGFSGSCDVGDCAGNGSELSEFNGKLASCSPGMHAASGQCATCVTSVSRKAGVVETVAIYLQRVFLNSLFFSSDV